MHRRNFLNNLYLNESDQVVRKCKLYITCKLDLVLFHFFSKLLNILEEKLDFETLNSVIMCQIKISLQSFIMPCIHSQKDSNYEKNKKFNVLFNKITIIWYDAYNVIKIQFSKSYVR